MAPFGMLYAVSVQPSAKRILSAAALAGISLDLPAVFTLEDTKTPEFLAKFPNGKIPALETADGFYLYETSAIARYISAQAPNGTLLGSSVEEAGLIDQWVSLIHLDISSNGALIVRLVDGLLTPYSKQNHAAFLAAEIRGIKTVEQHLATRTFLVGERITLADLTLATVMLRQVEIAIDAPLRAQFPNVMRHLETIANHPLLKDIFGTINYAEKAMQYTPPAKEKKEAKPAAKTEKKPKAKPAEEDDEEEDLLKEEPKARNPLDDLPKSPFNLEDWKRAYSNKETRGAGGALEWFYEHFDQGGFSLWRVDFKYNGELTQTFMSSNQIGGFFNRLEGSRKYLFGSVGVLGKTNDSIISGALILRGQDVKSVVEVAPDYESYSYERIDLNDAAQKAFFEAALAWDLEIDGKKWVDGKNFK